MNLSSINLDSCWKLFRSFPDNSIIYNKDAMLMIYWVALEYTAQGRKFKKSISIHCSKNPWGGVQ